VYRFGHLFTLVLRRRLGLLRPSTRPAASSPSPEALPVSR
jgi:hypothetical protein